MISFFQTTLTTAGVNPRPTVAEIIDQTIDLLSNKHNNGRDWRLSTANET